MGYILQGYQQHGDLADHHVCSLHNLGKRAINYQCIWVGDKDWSLRPLIHVIATIETTVEHTNNKHGLY